MFSGCLVGKVKWVFRMLGREDQNVFSGCLVGKVKWVFRMLGREDQMGFQDVG